MKANELMLGNFLEYKCVNDSMLKRWKFTGDWSEKRIDIYDMQEISEEGLDWEYRPITLTEEWLIRFGFEKKQGWNNFEFFTKDFVEIGIGEQFGKVVYFNSIDVVVDYVHQIQNLFFSLTGKEL